MSNHGYYQGTKEQPFHLSVGAVLYNEQSEIATHYFKEFELLGKVLDNFVVLMRETMEQGETVEQALARGLIEEFGATGDIQRFLGSYVSAFENSEGVSIEKTTLYFLVKCKSFDIARRKKGDPEGGSEVAWRSSNELIRLMKEQTKRIQYGTIDESSIIIRSQRYLTELPNSRL